MSSTTSTPEILPVEVEQPESAKRLLIELDDITENAIYAADPRQPVAKLAKAFAAYLRSAD